MADSNQEPNRLIHETSPYLLQHAYNPVNWYPWGQEAFHKAKSEKKPIFLSIGYSTCHWCHVMAHESFEDQEVADYLNAHFVSIKVDREERPDIDAVYMNVCQTLTGSGGWPLTIFMTPEQKPFYAGTYFPKRRRYGHPGILELLEAIKQSWDSDKKQLYSAGNEIAALFEHENKEITDDEMPDEICVDRAAEYFLQTFDAQNGGFGTAPKFPTPHNLMFLMRYYLLKKEDQILQMVETTLQQMYRGGIFDHIGFGFSRYSTDEKWLVPHFEKMLYDNAMLTIVLSETYAVTKNPLYKTVAEQTLAYIEREMTSPHGGFYSAQDADSEGEEGKFYTFTPDEVHSVLEKEDAEHVCHCLDITKDGNFEGKSIPNLLRNPNYQATDPILEHARPKLRDYRNQRTKLHKDDKILTSWNALMIVAYTKAYRYLGKVCYLTSALRALQFISDHLTDQDGILAISYREGKISGNGLLDDYAFLTWAYLELYDATFEVKYLTHALKLSETIIQRYADKKGGYFINADKGEKLLYRPKEQYDGAIPSGNSVFAYCLAKLAALTGESSWRAAADEQMRFYRIPFSKQPNSFSFALMAFMLSVYPTKEVVCVFPDDKEVTELISDVSGYFLPQTSIIVKTDKNAVQLGDAAPFTKEYLSKEGKKPLYYVCQYQSCSPPIYTVKELIEQIKPYE